MRAAGARAGGPRSPATLGAPRSGVYASRFNAATRGWEAAPPGGGAPAAPGAPPPPAAAARGAPPADAADADADAAADGLGLLALDPELAAHAEHLRYRWAAYSAAKESVERHGGGLLEFAKGHERFGVTRAGGATVVREWCPGAAAAQLVGDFNGWAGSHMARDAFGVWSLTLPDGAGGAPAIAHGSRLKIRLQHPGGWWVDRVPGWIRVARAEPGVMAAKFDGIHWDPPAAERYTFRHPRPPRPASLRVYEAHVGMAAEAERVATYAEFRDDVLPRIAAAGYNAVQLMAVQEHAYYASFGYHVTSPFAVASRSGTPEELKSLVDEAHRRGIVVLLDVVHSHISSNADDGLAGFDLGAGRGENYFLQGEAGYHAQWDSRLLDYGAFETLRYLLSNARFWLEEYQFDGFRFDGVTSMLYHHHGIDRGFSGNYAEYFSPATNVDAVVYLMLANELAHALVPSAITIAEDVSGMPGLARPVAEGGVGFDYRLGMGLPDFWIRLLKEKRDEEWSMTGLVSALCNRRYTERTVGYAESHDQALVGDQTLAFRLIGAEMYTGMSALTPPSPVVARGVALHKLIRAVTMALGGEAYLNFMGNEFGHPEWIDFPREGNNWSHAHCRRQWSLADASHLRYAHLLAWDAACMAADDAYGFIAHPTQWVTLADDGRQLLVAERGPLVFVFNFSPDKDYEGLEVPAPRPGKYLVAVDSDARAHGGEGRVGADAEHFTAPAATAADPSAQFCGRGQSMRVRAPARTCVAYVLEEDAAAAAAAKPAAAGAAAEGKGESGAAAPAGKAAGGGRKKAAAKKAA